MQTVRVLIANLSVFSTCIPLLFFIFNYRKQYNRTLKILWFYAACSFTADMVNRMLGLQGISNLQVINIFTYIEFVCVLLIYLFDHLTFFSRPVAWAIIAAYTLYYAFIFQLKLADERLYSPILEASLVIFLSTVYLIRSLDDIHIPRLADNYFFWINSAFLIYFSGSLFVFLFEENILTGKKALSYAWMIHNFFQVIKNVFIAVSIIKWQPIRK